MCQNCKCHQPQPVTLIFTNPDGGLEYFEGVPADKIDLVKEYFMTHDDWTPVMVVNVISHFGDVEQQVVNLKAHLEMQIASARSSHEMWSTWSEDRIAKEFFRCGDHVGIYRKTVETLRVRKIQDSQQLLHFWQSFYDQVYGLTHPE